VSEVIREAASVVAVRSGALGPEVLVMERSASSRFLPGYIVFPGGAVDEGDGARAASWFGLADEAPRAAAVRELVEEVGLALTAAGLVAVDGTRSLDAIGASPPARSQLREIAHWIAPPDVPVRFDARYFAVEAPPDLQPVPDPSEAARAWWARPGALMDDLRGGNRRLYWPTCYTMRHLAACRSVEESLALRIETREPDDEDLEQLPRSTFWQD
jgi:8-oxo-dGTP pyrophosphatase MutT (NUDIX family)